MERRWSNSNANSSNYKTDDSESNLSSRRPGSNKARLSYQYNRTNSLSTFHNSSILNYAKGTNTTCSSANESKKNSVENNKKPNSSPKNIKILQNHEKIMEVQNKWTGNGKFILMEKSCFLVCVFIKKNIIFRIKKHGIQKSQLYNISE